MPDFSADTPTPVYVRVADWVESRVKSGELQAGARLTAERELARDLGVAYDTVRRAAVLLRERGLIVTVHGRGTYVTEPPPQASDPEVATGRCGPSRSLSEAAAQPKIWSMTSAPLTSTGRSSLR